VSNKYNLGRAGRWGVCVLTLTVATLLDFSSAFAQSSSISEYEIPTVSSRPTSITSGPDGNLWFVETYSTNISKITPSGVITEFSLIYFAAQSIVSGPDGNLWFTTYGCVFCSPSASAGIGEIAPSGNSGSTYSFSVRVAHPYSITSGPDGNLWFTESNNIGRITPAGVISEFPIPSGNTATGITSGPDGNLWVANSQIIAGAVPLLQSCDNTTYWLVEFRYRLGQFRRKVPSNSAPAKLIDSVFSLAFSGANLNAIHGSIFDANRQPTSISARVYQSVISKRLTRVGRLPV
jgi:hypothetical protein